MQPDIYLFPTFILEIFEQKSNIKYIKHPEVINLSSQKNKTTRERSETAMREGESPCLRVRGNLFAPRGRHEARYPLELFRSLSHNESPQRRKPYMGTKKDSPRIVLDSKLLSSREILPLERACELC